jgi:hypothetical protein
MDEESKRTIAGREVSGPAKQPYKPPELREFGKLHRLTQSTGPNNGDGGQTMMM